MTWVEPTDKLADPLVIAKVIALLRGERTDEAEEPEPACEPTTLYRIFDALGRLLYVGMTCRKGLERFHEHAANPWWPEARTITLMHYPTRREALGAELLAIQSERPKYNVLGCLEESR
jgi:hypothetical protein